MDNSRAILAESTLIGCLISANHTFDRIADIVSETDFALAAHRSIFAAIAGLAAKDNPYDAVSVADALGAQGALDGVGGVPVLYDIADRFTTAANIKHYARLVREQSVLRQVAVIGDDIAEDARTAEDESAEILGRAQRRIEDIAEQAQRGAGAMDMRSVMRAALSDLEERAQHKGELIGVPSGYADFDRMTSGLCPSDLVILAARPSMGKTALALNIAEHAAVDRGLPTVFFSLEMSSESIGQRLVASRARVDMARLRAAELEEYEWARVTAATGVLSRGKLLIDDAPSLTTTDIAARSRRIARAHGGLSLIVVDYLQLISTKGRVENRNVEVMKISQELKALAKAMKAPVIALSQLSRGVEQRTNKRPMMSDLRDSGGIEQDADLVLLLYRDEYYNSESPDAGTAELIIAKHRNGPTGTVRLAFSGAICRFDALSQDWAPQRREQGKKAKSRSADYDY